jgi:CBS domain-containing protein
LLDEREELAGIITRSDVVRALEQHPQEELTVLDAGQRDPVVTFAEETLHDAVAKMLKHDLGRLPVVDRHERKRVVGYLGRASILAARQQYYDEEEVRGRGFGFTAEAEVPAG